MTLSLPIQLIGSPPSPYTRKMISILRYRRIPYSLTWGDPAAELTKMGVAKPKIGFLPTFLLPDEAGALQAVCDSTPIIRRLESEIEGRSVIPTDAALAFIDYLLEDFADEWCTKYMFHYRWHFDEDADNAGTLLPLNHSVDMGTDQLTHFKPYITERQVGRLHVVGSNDVTAPVIDASYRRLLSAMELHLEQQPYLLGKRPGAADFALYGQFSQLVGFDPTPRAIAHKLSPRTVAWTGLMEDQTGLEPQDSDWVAIEDSGSGLKAILTEVGRVYPDCVVGQCWGTAGG